MRLAASARSEPPPSIPHVIATPPSSRGPYAAPSRPTCGALAARLLRPSILARPYTRRSAAHPQV